MSPDPASRIASLELARFLPGELLPELRLRRYEPGEHLIRSGDPVAELLILVEGRVQVTLDAENGKRLLFCFYEPPRLLGELEILDPEDPPATSNVEALSASECLALPRSILAERLTGDPLLLREIGLSLARKLRRVLRNSALNQLYPLEARAASYVLAASVRLSDGRLLFAPNLSRVAELLGASFRHLHRTLGSLATEGLLEKGPRGYIVIDEAELGRRAGSSYVGA